MAAGGAHDATHSAQATAEERGEHIEVLQQQAGDTQEAARQLHSDAAELRRKLERENQWACRIL